MRLILLSVFSQRRSRKHHWTSESSVPSHFLFSHPWGILSCTQRPDTCHLENRFLPQEWVWGDLLPSRISASWTRPLSSGASGTSWLQQHLSNLLLGKQPLYYRVYRVLLSHSVQSVNQERNLGLLAEIVCLRSEHQPVTHVATWPEAGKQTVL